MALKMAKGSLFAVLLRSSWWYSVLIGLFILLVSLALTDAKYVVLSITGSLPFLIIGAIAAYKVVPMAGGWKLAGVFTSTYVGGTMNFLATADAVRVRSHILCAVHAYLFALLVHVH